MDEWDHFLELANLEAGIEGAATWVDLAAAEEATGASRSALRSWYRSGQVPSRVVDGPHGPQRMVALEAVAERARQSPKLQRKAAREASLEAEVAALRARVTELERRLAALEAARS
jgi:transposase